MRRSRSVIWDVDSPERDVEPPEVPREKSSFRVYFLDRSVEQNERARRVLGLAGRPWGVRVYDGAPSYFRELLDTFATPEPTQVEALDFYFLAKQIDKIGDDSPDLLTREGSFIALDYVESAVSRSDGDQRQNLRRRLDLRNDFLALPRDGPTLPFDEAILDDDWQRVRARANGDDSFGEWGSFDGSAAETWPAPSAEPWVPIAKAVNTEDAGDRIARTLSLLGASVLPGVRTVWMYGSGHPWPRGGASWDPVEWTSGDYRSIDALPETTVGTSQTGSQISTTTADQSGRSERTTAVHDAG